MDRGAWGATVHRVAESDMTEVIYYAHMNTFKLYLNKQLKGNSK